MKTSTIAISVVLLVALLVGWQSAFTVSEVELAAVFRFSKIERYDYEPGLHFMVPFINKVKKFDKRILTLDERPQRILIGEKKYVDLDYFVKWKIIEVKKFYRAFGVESQAAVRMNAIIKDGLQKELGSRTLREAISGERAEIMANINERADAELTKFGIRVLDVRIKQIELPNKAQESVFDRMRTERLRQAKDYRAQGEKKKQIIVAKADRKVKESIAKGKQDAEVIKGQGDAMATEIYAKAYGKNAKFYEFYRSLEAYRKTFNSKSDVFVLEPDSEFFRYFGSVSGTR
ncbi:MAG TPA: protease modulator HflC [Gammaproteobacteria bacterium]|nr:protease modulator HflC [Gammaproteobacteria bacterium]